MPRLDPAMPSPFYSHSCGAGWQMVHLMDPDADFEATVCPVCGGEPVLRYTLGELLETARQAVGSPELTAAAAGADGVDVPGRQQIARGIIDAGRGALRAAGEEPDPDA